MSKIGMTPNTAQTVQAPDMPDSSIEEQINALHDSLDTLDGQMGLLRDNLSEVLCPVSDQDSNAPPVTPLMSLTAERIFAAERRVVEHMMFVGWLNENLNIKDKSNV
jgi:hypothetical protein